MESKSFPFSFTGVLLAFFPVVYVIHYHLGRPDLMPEMYWHPSLFISLMLIWFAGYAWTLRFSHDDLRVRMALGAGIALRLMLVFALPAFSDDFFRFVWDGHIGLSGINPYHYTPAECMASGASLPETARSIFPFLNSPTYHSVYPPMLQGAFQLAAYCGGSLEGTVLVLKLWVVMAEVLSIWFIYKLANALSLSNKAPVVYALNPLVIFELSGNLHFEAFMLCFLLGAIWMLFRSNMLPAALLFTSAVASKVLPLLAMPFLLRRLGWRSILLTGLTGALVLGIMGVFFFDEKAIVNFQRSLGLYFQHFEFNGGVYLLFKWMAGDAYFWVQRLLPWGVFAGVMWMAWREKKRSWSGFITQAMLALALYQICSPVVHPWYLAPIVGLCALSPYRFPLVWSALIPFTYLAYRSDGEVVENPWVIGLESGVVLGCWTYESLIGQSGKTLEELLHEFPFVRRVLAWTIPARMRIKLHRIQPHLPGRMPILDLGTGNGGLCLQLIRQGHDVQPLDIRNISLFPEVNPMIYDGQHIPFADRKFHTTLLITMLHHTPDPNKVLAEALRVTSHRLVVMEDIYRNPVQKHLTLFMDSLVNLEFRGHPHTNRDDNQWKQTFHQMGLKVVAEDEFRTLIFFRQKIYVLERITVLP